MDLSSNLPPFLAQPKQIIEHGPSRCLFLRSDYVICSYLFDKFLRGVYDRIDVDNGGRAAARPKLSVSYY